MHSGVLIYTSVAMDTFGTNLTVDFCYIFLFYVLIIYIYMLMILMYCDLHA